MARPRGMPRCSMPFLTPSLARYRSPAPGCPGLSAPHRRGLPFTRAVRNSSRTLAAEATMRRCRTLIPATLSLFCTDGVTDSTSMDGENFGTERLVAICNEHCADSPTRLLQAIFCAVEIFSRGHGPDDDMAAALFSYSEIKPRQRAPIQRLSARRVHPLPGPQMYYKARLLNQECRDCASLSGFPIDSSRSPVTTIENADLRNFSRRVR